MLSYVYDHRLFSTIFRFPSLIDKHRAGKDSSDLLCSSTNFERRFSTEMSIFITTRKKEKFISHRDMRNRILTGRLMKRQCGIDVRGSDKTGNHVITWSDIGETIRSTTILFTTSFRGLLTR